MKRSRYLRVVQAPPAARGHAGLRHLSDAKRSSRTLCGKGVFVRDGWRLLSSASGVVSFDGGCQVCSRIGRRRYGLR